MPPKTRQSQVLNTAGMEVAKKAGRPPSKQAQKYGEYRKIEGFKHCAVDPWWSKSEWSDMVRSSKANMHAGFLWEAVRRMPDFQTLLEGFRQLSGKLRVGEVPITPDLIENEQNFVRFIKEFGMLVVDSLEILLSHWKLDFGNIPQDARERWFACYLAFWSKVGERGSVPTIPAEMPVENETGPFTGQGRTAFDLLIKIPGDGPRRFVDRPLPTLFLDAFAEVRTSEGSPEASLSQGAETPRRESNLVLKFGFLERHLKRHNMQPLALAVDLSKSTESIVRDFRRIIEDKRISLEICIADRRIKVESFRKIQTLDGEIFLSDGDPPLTKTVKEFEASAQIDLIPLISQFKLLSCDRMQIPPERKRNPKPSKKKN